MSQYSIFVSDYDEILGHVKGKKNADTEVSFQNVKTSENTQLWSKPLKPSTGNSYSSTKCVCVSVCVSSE